MDNSGTPTPSSRENMSAELPISGNKNSSLDLIDDVKCGLIIMFFSKISNQYFEE